MVREKYLEMTESIEDRLEVLLKAGAEPAEAKLVGMEQQEQMNRSILQLKYSLRRNLSDRVLNLSPQRLRMKQRSRLLLLQLWKISRKS